MKAARRLVRAGVEDEDEEAVALCPPSRSPPWPVWLKDGLIFADYIDTDVGGSFMMLWWRDSSSESRKNRFAGFAYQRLPLRLHLT